MEGGVLSWCPHLTVADDVVLHLRVALGQLQAPLWTIMNIVMLRQLSLGGVLARSAYDAVALTMKWRLPMAAKPLLTIV